MQTLEFSFIIPVYNRPNEVEELLESFLNLEAQTAFEIVIIEDGSTEDCKSVFSSFSSFLNISYYEKPNSGPGDSRNFGMRKAKGNYFIILDSDCILPSDYLMKVQQSLNNKFVDCYGGPDAAHESFSTLQKAINFTMTSFLTTGGIRGGAAAIKNFQPRSFNMGLSKSAFMASRGFGSIHPGEDPDLSIRLKGLGFETALFPKAFVYHKRRLSWRKFYQQVYKFGLVRPILNAWHPKTARWSYWLPSVFSLGFFIGILLALIGFWLPMIIYVIYVMLVFISAVINSKSLSVAFQSILAIFIQFFGYGFGFLKSSFAIKILKKDPKQRFPKLFFDNVH